MRGEMQQMCTSRGDTTPIMGNVDPGGASRRRGVPRCEKSRYRRWRRGYTIHTYVGWDLALQRGIFLADGSVCLGGRPDSQWAAVALVNGSGLVGVRNSEISMPMWVGIQLDRAPYRAWMVVLRRSCRSLWFVGVTAADND